MNKPQVSIFPAEMTTALYRRAIASAWRQKTLNETGSDQYGPHSLTVERIEMAIALHIECALINEYGEAQGAALTSALAPFLKGRGGLEVASRMLRSALVRQLAITPPEIAGDYREILDESGVIPDPVMVRDCQSTYTPAQHLRFQQRLNYINDMQE
ncbi:hypothetical protein HG838_002486 [Salmonella enterica]|nr:hypothetical protein [Salmonella enterica]EGQ6779420.1 hypothetical protein [Salmonella enterica]HAK8816071.1 hypothetical protein [Salmonella enterica]